MGTRNHAHSAFSRGTRAEDGIGLSRWIVYDLVVKVCKRKVAILLLALPIALLTACQMERDYNGYGILYGCDGSGAGLGLRWDLSAHQGMRDAGFRGIIRSFAWQTGGGMLADHTSSVEYKRSESANLARQIADHRREFPRDPIYICDFSAGCAVMIYALEELPDDVWVDQCMLLSSSVSSQYDLTKALAHIRGHLYVTTSPHDAVLKELVKAVGSADRLSSGIELSGLKGFTLPPSADAATMAAYTQKIRTLPWREEFAQYGNHGGHTDVMVSEFIKKVIAPLVLPAIRYW